ncbi:MAG: fimbria major subunit [Muribaculaceae bacterium]|nr:fimbria major subunit [Muribaculaceae bacterium]
MKSELYLGVIAVLLALSACSHDDGLSKDDTPMENTKVEYDQMRYIAVQIGAPKDAQSRAFENGALNESYINRLDFFFYDATGNPTSTPLSITEKEISNDGEFGKPDPNQSGSNVTRIYTSVIPVALTQGQNLPSQIICVVNGVESGVNEIKSLPLSNLIDIQRTYFSNQSCFVMTNSVYYGRDIVTGQTNQRLCATPINSNTQLFGTKEAAQKAITDATAGALVDIYVERVAAKVGINLDKNNIKDYELETSDGAKVSLTFVPHYWVMNATDKSTYLTKRYGVESSEGGVHTINQLPTFDEINQALNGGGFISWNDAPNHRSYWGTSPSYFANNYPDVSDDVNDLVEPTHENEFDPKYYSYNELSTRSGQGISSQAIAAVNGSFITGYTGFHEGYEGEMANGYIYTRETTVAKARINDVNSSNPAAAVASAVVVGKYSVTGANTENGTFYIDRNTGENGIYYSTATEVIKTLAERQSIVFDDDQGKNPSRASVFRLKHPDYAVRTKAQTKLAGRLVTLQLTSLPTDRHLYYYAIKEDGTGGYVEISQENLVDVNTQLLSVGYMDKFADGLAFYSIPIRHLNWNDDFYVTKWTEEKEINGEIVTVEHEKPIGYYDWGAMTTGSIGVVRNHVYNLTINSITGLGTALRDPDQPIVPAKEEANQYIAVRLNILAWNVASTWSVDI